MTEIVRTSLVNSKAFFKEFFGAIKTITSICALIVFVYFLGLVEGYRATEAEKQLGKLISYRILERMMGYRYEEIDYNEFFKP